MNNYDVKVFNCNMNCIEREELKNKLTSETARADKAEADLKILLGTCTMASYCADGCPECKENITSAISRIRGEL